MAAFSRFRQKLRASERWRAAFKRVRGSSGAIAGVLGAVAATALFTSTPWAHGWLQKMIWVAAAVALVVCVVASIIGPGEPVQKPVVPPEYVEPVSGGPESEGYMGASDAQLEQAYKEANQRSSPAVPDSQAEGKSTS